jgi:hypothetical protein
MVVQADGASYALDSEPERARQALATIAATGRQALAEMRRLLGVLRSGDSPAELAPLPGVDQLRDLLDQTRAAGRTVSFTLEARPGRCPRASAWPPTGWSRNPHEHPQARRDQGIGGRIRCATQPMSCWCR